MKIRNMSVDIETDLLIKVSNLTKGKIYDRRKEIRKSIILAILSDYKTDAKINIKKLKNDIFNKTKLKIDENIIVDELSKISEEDFIQFISENTFQLKKKIDIQKLSNIIKPVWNEFEEHIKKNYSEYDLYLDKDAERIFESILIKLLTQFDVQVEKMETQLDTIDMDKFKTIIKKIVEKSPLSRDFSPKFPDIFCSFVDLKTPNLLTFIFNHYTLIINIDLLKNIQKIPTLDFIKHLKFLLLDTNFIISLLCKNHNDHLMAVTVVKQCQKSNIPIYFSPITQHEIRGQISYAKFEMKGLRPRQKHSIIASPFVEDFSKSGMNWSDYVTILDYWEVTLMKEFNTLLLKDKYKLPIDKEAYSYVSEFLPMLDETRIAERRKNNPEYNKELRSEGQYTHDATCISLISANRKKNEKGKTNESIGPWFLSFDSLLLSLDRAYSKKRKKLEFVIHPKTLLNYLLAYAKIEYNKDDELEVASAILSYTCKSSEKNMTIKEYANLITQKIGLEKADSKVLESILFASPLLESLELALEKNQGEKADEITSSIIANDEFVDKILERKKDKEIIKTLQQKYNEEKIARKTAENIAQNISINLSFVMDITIKTKLDGLISILESENAFDNGKLKRPENISNIDKLKEWLIKTKDTINATKELGESLKFVIPIITNIISALT